MGTDIEPLYRANQLAKEGDQDGRSKIVHRVHTHPLVFQCRGVTTLQTLRLATQSVDRKVQPSGGAAAPRQTDIRAVRGPVHRTQTRAAAGVHQLHVPASGFLAERGLAPLPYLHGRETVEGRQTEGGT